MKRRILALIVTMATMLSALGMTAFAAGETMPVAPSSASYYGSTPTYAPASADGTAMVLSWRNPETQPQKVSLYNITDASAPTLIADNYSIDADTPVVTTVNELTNGTKYLFKVQFDFADGTQTSMVMGGTSKAYKSGEEAVGNSPQWKLKSPSAVALNTMIMYHDPEVKNSGNASLYIANNTDSFQDFVLDMFTNFAVPADGSVKLTMKVKANGYVTRNENIAQFLQRGEQYKMSIQNQDVNGSPIEFDWQNIEINVGGTNTMSMLYLNLPQMTAKDLWLTDLKLMPYDSNGIEDVTKPIHIYNFDNYTPAPDVTEANVQSNDGGKSISYTIPENTRSVLVYRKVGDKLMYYANVSDLDNFPIDALQSEGENEFVIKALSDKFALSTGVTVQATPVPPKEKDYYGYAPTFAPTAEADGKAQMVLSWRNPVVQPTKVSLYDITDPKNPVKKGDDFLTAANSGVRTTLSGLTKNQRYVYKVVFDFENHASTSLFIGGSATGDVGDNSAPRISGTNWQTLRKANKQYGLIENIDTTVAHSGKASFHISNNSEDFQERVLRLPFVFLNPMPSTSEGTKFKCTMWVKGDQYVTRRTDGHFGAIGSVPSVQTINNQSVGGAPIDFDWKEITMEATVGAGWNAGATFINCYLPSSSAKDIWVDDIRLVEVNADGTEKEWDVEGFEDSVAPGNVTEASVASVGDASATISYNVPDGIETVFVYQKIDGELVQRANIAGSGSIELDALINDQENEIIIKTLSGSNDGKYAVSEGVTLTAAPEKPKYRTGEFKLYSGTEETEKPAAGAMTVKLDVENIAMGNDFTPCLIVAVYDGDRMVDCVVADKTVVAEGAKATLSADITVQSGIQNCRLKAFLWKNFDTMGILRDCKEF